MHSMSNLNKFKDSYQVLEKNPGLCFTRKINSRIPKECLNNSFWPKIFTTNTLYVNVYKIYECDKNQMPCYNVKSFKSQISGNFGPFIEHGLHWINFIILTFISENNRYFKGLYKIWNKIILINMRKNGEM
jgi:hypothetical protein